MHYPEPFHLLAYGGGGPSGNTLKMLSAMHVGDTSALTPPNEAWPARGIPSGALLSGSLVEELAHLQNTY